MKTRLKKLSAREALMLDRSIRAREAARDRFNAESRAADRALASVLPDEAKDRKGLVTLEEDGEDAWLCLEEPEPAAGPAVDAGEGGDGESRMRPVPAEPGREPPPHPAIRT